MESLLANPKTSEANRKRLKKALSAIRQQHKKIDKSKVEGEGLEGYDKDTRERINEDINNNLRGSKGQWLGDPKDDWLSEKNTLEHYDEQDWTDTERWSDQDLLDELKEDVPYQFKTMIMGEIERRKKVKKEDEDKAAAAALI